MWGHGRGPELQALACFICCCDLLKGHFPVTGHRNGLNGKESVKGMRACEKSLSARDLRQKQVASELAVWRKADWGLLVPGLHLDVRISLLFNICSNHRRDPNAQTGTDSELQQLSLLTHLREGGMQTRFFVSNAHWIVLPLTGRWLCALCYVLPKKTTW